MASDLMFELANAKQVLNPVKSPSMPFDWSINPYRGCQHGCSFCYARSSHAFLGLAADDAFQRHIVYKANARDSLEAQLQRMLRSKQARKRLGKIAIGTVTDPYQPIESRLQLTRQCLEVLAAYQVPASITTRSPLILRDLDVLRRIPECSVNVSINTMDTGIWRSMEPSTPSPAKRFEAVRGLSAAGIGAGVFLAPILPFLTDDAKTLEDIVRRAAEADAAVVMGSRLRLSTQAVKSWFFQTIREQYPHLLARYADWYAQTAYAPKAYRDGISATLLELLQRYNLPSLADALAAAQEESTDSAETEQPDPVQLSFAFDA